MTAQQSGANIDFVSAISGAFEMDFRVFSQTSPSEEELENKMFYPTSDLQSMSIIFTDANDENNTFSIVIESSTALGAIPTAHVEVQGKSLGIFRLARTYWAGYGVYNEPNPFDPNGFFGGYNQANGETKLANANGEYAYLLDSSFSNVAWYRGGYYKTWTTGTGDNTVENTIAPLRVGFDPLTMEVYGYSRNEKILIWDLDASINDGYDAGVLVDGFESYNTSIEFTKLNNENKPVNMVVYAVNGQSVTTTSETDTIAPSIYAKATSLGLIGNEYKIPEPKAYDLMDGVIASVDVDVTDPEGNAVTCKGLSDGKYAKNSSFLPKKAGVYTITYKTKDAKGNESTVSQNVNVCAALPASIFNFNEDAPHNITVGKGTTVTLPCPLVVNEYFSVSLTPKVSIKKGNESILAERPIAEKSSYVFTEQGIYTVIYSVAETSDKFTFDVVVDETLPMYSFSGEWQPVYALNTRIEIPTCTATFEGEQVECSSILELPDGTRYLNKEFTATIAGKYKAIYSAKFGESTYENIQEFSVIESAESLFTSVSNIEFQGIKEASFNDLNKGLLVRSEGVGKLQYNRPINFNDKTAKDVFFEFSLSPETRDVAEANKLMITLTDVNDKMNYVQIIIHRDMDMDGFSDIRAGAYGQKTIGLRGTGICDMDPWGTMIGHSFLRGASDATLRFSMDYNTKTLYVNDTKVVDLDSPEYFKTIWEGFSDGRAMLSLEVVTANTPYVHYLIHSIDGNDLRVNTVADNQAPILKIDLGNYTKNTLPFGVVGTKYSLFSATAYDAHDGFLPYEVSCYYLLNGLKCEVDITDGTFTPTKAQEYYIDYWTMDGAGNYVMETLSIDVQAESELSVVLSETEGTGMTGFCIQLPNLMVYGNSGELMQTNTVTKPNGVKESFGEEYLPVEDGEYVFEYTICDYLGFKKQVVYTYTATNNDMPIIERVELPAIIIQGEEIAFPNCVVYDYSDGTQKFAEAIIKVLYNGQESIVENGVFTPLVLEQDADMTVSYVATLANGNTDQIDYTIHTVTMKDVAGNVSFSKLFNGENFKVEDGETLVYYTETEDATLNLVRSVVANDVSFDFAIPAGYDNFTSLVITLSEMNNPNNSFFVTIRKSDNIGKTIWVVSGDKTEYEVVGGFGESIGDFYFGYDDSTSILSTKNESEGQVSLCSILYDSNGNKFKGFSSGLVNLSFTFKGLTGVAGIAPSRLNNVALKNVKEKDTTQPLLYICGDYSMYIEYGSQQTLYKAVASDVLSGTKVQVSIIGPNGETVYTGSADNDIVFDVNMYGSYLIQYQAQDLAGRKFTKKIPLYCPYVGDVEIKLDGGIAEKAKVNQTIQIPAFTAHNEIFDDISGYVIVFDPNNSMKVICGNEGGEYTFLLKGKYVIRYYAMDDDGNYKMVDYIVLVS